MKKYLYSLITLAAIMILVLGLGTADASADQLNVSFSSTDGSTCYRISDGYFNFEDLENSYEVFDAGTEITLTSSEPIDSIYIKFYYKPGKWKIRVGEKEYTYGEESFLHEYVKLPADIAGTNSVTIILTEKEWIIDVYAFSAGTLPDFVQTWESPYDEADILLLSTHADDECLFFGGIIPNYTDRGVRVQVAYFTDLFQTEPYRAQEILDGLWEMGVTHYPQLGEFYDYYSESYEQAAAQYDMDASVEFCTRVIRRFKPQVVIGQDIIAGEYGHGGHIWSATALAKAVEASGDASQYPESATLYGSWEVPKTYMHLYPENQILLDARVPLASLGGRTAVQAAEDAYEKHASQHWCWFYVDDDCIDPDGNPTEKDLRCTLYGLYDTKVGYDVLGNDIMENITPYDEQKAPQPEETTVDTGAADAPAEGQTGEDGQILNPDDSITPADDPAASTVVDDKNNNKQAGNHSTLITILIIAAAIVLVIIIAIIILSAMRAKKAAEEERRRRAAAARRRQMAAQGERQQRPQGVRAADPRAVQQRKARQHQSQARAQQHRARTSNRTK